MKEQQLGVEVESMRNRVLKNRGMPLILKQLFLQKGIIYSNSTSKFY